MVQVKLEIIHRVKHSIGLGVLPTLAEVVFYLPLPRCSNTFLSAQLQNISASIPVTPGANFIFLSIELHA